MRSPTAPGVNLTFTVQEPPGASDRPVQASLDPSTAKSAAAAPVTLNPLTVRRSTPSLVRVTGLAAVVPTSWPP